MDWTILLSEITIRTSRSSGAGGQHVNKTETRVEVLLDIPSSMALNEEEKKLIFQKLANRINSEGVLSVVSQQERSQGANRELALARLKDLLTKALVPAVKRVKTRPTGQSIEDRLNQKKRMAEKKASRQKPRL